MGMGSLLNSCNLSAKSKLKSKSKTKHSDSNKVVANAESKLMKSANAQPKCMFLVRHKHNLVRHKHYNEIPDYSVISTEGNSFRVLDEDDDDLPRNLLSLLRSKNNVFDVRECCGSWIWLLHEETGVAPQDFVWDMETDTCISHSFPSVFSSRINDSVWAYGFGFDPSSGHYKLVRCRWVACFVERYAEVFSLTTGSWKAVHFPYGLHVCPSVRPSIHINGFYYWIVWSEPDESSAIMSFDFAKDQFNALIPLPYKEKSRRFVKVAVVEFQGSLAAVCCDPKDNPFVLEIWAWNARGSFWSLVSTFDIPAAAAPRAVLKLYKNDKLFLEDSKGDLLLYDHATRRLENLRIPIDRRGFSEFFPYVKSCVGPSSRD